MSALTKRSANALFYILSGEDQPVGTMFQIFSVIIETIKDPLFAKIEFDWDLEKRRAKVEVPGVVRAHSEPIRNPVTDEEHRMLTVLPKGWVFHEAENARLRQGAGRNKVRPEPAPQLAGPCRLEPEWSGFTAMTSISRNSAGHNHEWQDRFDQ